MQMQRSFCQRRAAVGAAALSFLVLLLQVHASDSDIVRGSTKDDRRYACSSKSDCTSIDCTDNQAAYRAGYLCHNFPWFNGYYPWSALQWDDEQELYTCVTATNNTFCQRWSADENSGGEAETGFCDCDRADSTGQFCQEWSCEQTEVLSFATMWSLPPYSIGAHVLMTFSDLPYQG